jgi:hypothetical protein
MTTALTKWLLSDDTGVSSKAIAAHLTGDTKQGKFGDYPSDGDDFGRCYRLLVCVPEFAPRIGELATRSPQWAALVKHWSELTEMYIRKDKCIYKRMKEILATAPDKNRISFGGGSISFERSA